MTKEEYLSWARFCVDVNSRARDGLKKHIQALAEHDPEAARLEAERVKAADRTAAYLRSRLEGKSK